MGNDHCVARQIVKTGLFLLNSNENSNNIQEYANLNNKEANLLYIGPVYCLRNANAGEFTVNYMYI